MFSERLKERRLAVGLSQKALGEAVGYTKSAASTWERGVCKPPVDVIEDIAELLHTTAKYLLGYTDEPEDYEKAEELNALPTEWYAHFNGDTEAAVKAYRAMDVDRSSLPKDAIPITQHRVPILGGIHCGDPAFAEEYFEGYVDAGSTVRCDYALRAVGDSMVNARIMDGDIVFIRKQDTVEDGEIAAVCIDDETTLKRVRFLPNGMLMLSPENPKYQPLFVGGADDTRDVRILGKAVAFQADVR